MKSIFGNLAVVSLLLFVLAYLTYFVAPGLFIDGPAPAAGDTAAAQMSLLQNFSLYRLCYGIAALAAFAAFMTALWRICQTRRLWGLTVLSLVLAIPAALFGGWMTYVMSRVSGSEAQTAQWNGTQAPVLVMQTIDGQTLDLQQLKGKRILINHWATWCAPCRDELPEFKKVAAGNRDDLLIIGLSIEDPELVATYAKREQINYPLVAVSKEQFESYPAVFQLVPFLPTSFIIDRNGVIQTVHAGVMNEELLRTLFTDAEDFSGTVKPSPEA